MQLFLSTRKPPRNGFKIFFSIFQNMESTHFVLELAV